jgi:hypothetical protein
VNARRHDAGGDVLCQRRRATGDGHQRINWIGGHRICGRRSLPILSLLISLVEAAFVVCPIGGELLLCRLSPPISLALPGKFAAGVGYGLSETA